MIRRVFSYTALLLALSVIIFTVTTAVHTEPAHAVTGSDWNAGNIISDGLFYDNTAMSVVDIQNFLNSKVASCDTNGTQKNAANPSMTNAQYAASQGWPGPPYVCLRNYMQVPQSSSIVDNFSGSTPSGAISAAQIIKNAADSYGINPRAILVTLQKESLNLIYDTWPIQYQYKNAMGYGCPDTAPCDPSYAGFYNQINNAAYQFKLYMTNPSSYRYKPFQSNSVYYNPSSGCGASNVSIQDYATAGLYNYTPYQPNAAALNNLYGSGDGCSAYGNRNFWRIYNDWFGSTQSPPYYSEYNSETPSPTLPLGSSQAATIRYKNMGGEVWYDSTSASAHNTLPVVLATMNNLNRCSALASSSWQSCSRPTTVFTKVYLSDGITLAPDQHSVQPTQIAEYTFTLQAQADMYTGLYNEYFAPIREGAQGWGWYMGADNVFLDVHITNSYKAAYSSQSSYPTISQNSRSNAFVRFSNTGTSPWRDSTSASQAGVKPVVLGTDGPVNRASAFSSTWPNPARPGTTFSKVYESDGVTLATDQHTAQPGQIVEYDFTLTATQNQKPGLYREYFQLLREGAINWPIDNAGAHLDVTVAQSNYRASYASESPSVSFTTGSTSSYSLSFSLKNTGGTTWYDDDGWTPGILPTHFAATWPINRNSVFYRSEWRNSARPSTTFSKVY